MPKRKRVVDDNEEEESKIPACWIEDSETGQAIGTVIGFKTLEEAQEYAKKENDKIYGQYDTTAKWMDESIAITNCVLNVKKKKTKKTLLKQQK